VKSITAYRKIKDWGTLDQDLSPEPIYDAIDICEDVHFTQEIRLTSPLFEHYYFYGHRIYIDIPGKHVLDVAARDASIDEPNARGWHSTY